PHVAALPVERIEKPPDRLCTAERDDRDAVCFEVPAPARGERLQRDLVADALDEHHRLGHGRGKIHRYCISRLWLSGPWGRGRSALTEIVRRFGHERARLRARHERDA